MRAPNGPRFLEAAADWATARQVDMTFARDIYGDWSATAHLKDARGPFIATVTPPPDRDRESPEEFDKRVWDDCTKAVVRARRERMTNHTGVPVSRHYGDEARA